VDAAGVVLHLQEGTVLAATEWSCGVSGACEGVSMG
jgi:hypothetical protein